MEITKIKVQNYRLLKDFSLDLKNNLSLIVGKNNCGKTSVLSILEKVFNRNSNKPIGWEDINLSHRKEIFKRVKEIYSDESESESESESEDIMGIDLQIWIQYTESDSYQNIQTFMMDLNPDNSFIILEFSYIIPSSKIQHLKDINNTVKDDFFEFESFMKKNMHKFFELQIRSLGYEPSTNELTGEKSELLEMKDIHKIIKIRGISASREVSNKENNHSLSRISNRFYKLNSGDDVDSETNNLLQEAITEADKTLTRAYNGDEEHKGIFDSVFKRVKKFGGNDNSAELAIQSSLSERDILSNNTTLYYKHDDSILPEMYNGLGYLNLYSMIFEIETLMTDIKREPADINLIYIEEPESHAHPQLQYVFIKNIKNLIEDHRKELNNSGSVVSNIQTLITTHSSHIVSDCDFDDLIYFKRDNDTITSKSFNSLKQEYNDDERGYKFVKQYLTLNNSELFFADKVICIEGDTERILLPTMMQKVDKENAIESGKNIMPLLSQNISIIETGAHSQVFKKFFDFLGIKGLIITDLDSAIKRNARYVACSPTEGTHTSNSSIVSFFGGKNSLITNSNQTQLELIIKKEDSDKCIGNFRIAYQIPETKDGYQASSFEDAFISLNKDFITDNKENFIKYGALKRFNINSLNNLYNFARKKIEKKSAFASSLLYFENENSTWKVPKYISEGLLWLRDQ